MRIVSRISRCVSLLALLSTGLSPVAHANPHSGDYREPFGAFTLEELLRIIQLYNFGSYGCEAEGESEDGFSTAGLPCEEAFHDGDYLPPFGQFTLSEVLRLIQFYNAGGYSPDCDGTSEDGFLVTLAGLESCDPEGSVEGEGTAEGLLEGAAEGGEEGSIEGQLEGTLEGDVEGSAEGVEEGEGTAEGSEEGVGEGIEEGNVEGIFEGVNEGEQEGLSEGASEGTSEGVSEGSFEGLPEGGLEGAPEGIVEGVVEGGEEGTTEGTFEGIFEGSLEGSPEGNFEGAVEGAFEGEGQLEGEPEGTIEGTQEGIEEGAIEGAIEGSLEGAVEGALEGEGALEPEPGPFAIGVTNRVFTDPSRSNRSIPAAIYYPAVAAGSNQPIAGNEANRFPVVVFGHGFIIGIGFYDYIWNGLVPSGYIVVMCDTETTISPNHGNFGRDLAFLVDAFQQEGANPASFFFNRVAAKSAVGGHSMGGGATMLSVQHSANISTIVPIAAADTNPSAIAAAPGISIPALVIAGSKDCVAPPASNAKPMYDGLASACRHYANIVDGSHCQFAVNSTICDLGQIICPGQTYVSAAGQRATTVGLMRAWFDVVLKETSTLSDFAVQLQQEVSAGRVAAESDCS